MSTDSTERPYTAGIYEQCSHVSVCGCTDGWQRRAWSHHATQDLAERAARRYARSLSSPTGGMYSWSAWWRGPDEVEHEIRYVDAL